MEFELFPTPQRAAYRSYDPESTDRRMYAVMLNKVYLNTNLVIRDNETAVAVGDLELQGTATLSLLGTARLVILGG